MSDKMKVQAISLSRIVVALLIVSLSYVLAPNLLERPPAACLMLLLVIYVLATDVFDGHYARKWQVVSPEGKLIDPFCDALAMLFIYWSLVEMGRIWSVAALIIIVRNFCSAYYRSLVLLSQKDPAALRSGKIKTVIQGIAALLLMALPLYSNILRAGIVIATLSWVVIVVTALSFLEYIWVAYRQRRSGQ